MDHHVFPDVQPGLHPQDIRHQRRAMDAHAAARTLMVQGTTSDAGKSALVTGLCRILQRRGIRVAPFKPQNMALNSAVTADGGEIGRAQAVQAQACGLEPTVHMNPILLKPNTDIGAQVIVQGRALTDMDAQDYHTYKSTALHAVLDSYTRLRDTYDCVLVEGAGSPAEINLRDRDVANMGFAERADCPVILVADIDRGGVFAHLYGTLALLSASEQARIKGFVINRFRGDITLLEPGLRWLEHQTGKRVLGVLPYLHGLHLEAEDAINTYQHLATDGAHLRVIVPVMPRISNHTDCDPLRLHPQVDLQFVAPDTPIPPADVILLPGSKSVRSDLDWLRRQGWPQAIARHLRFGGKVIGICGGFQMLGTSVSDPAGLEGPAGKSPGLGFLDIHTVLEPEKQLRNVRGQLLIPGADPVPVRGYEIHTGVTTGPGLTTPVADLGNRADGALSPDGQVLGTYLHGMFEEPTACAALLRWAGLPQVKMRDYRALQEEGINRFADACEAHVDINAILCMAGLIGT